MNNILKHLSLSILILSLFACSKENAPQNTNEAKSQKQSAQPVEQPAIAPEDDPKLTGTPVLGFKLRDSTYDSVKKRLQNYQVSDDKSYAGGPILENDGSGFDIDGLQATQFGFDQNNKLVYVWMSGKDADHRGKATYKKLVSYIKQRDYKVVRSVEPFVGNRSTEFSTPNHEIINVNSPHMDFNIYVEYLTQEFAQERNKIQQQSKEEKVNKESNNF